ncbi:MAG: DUF1593 domain-containing protein [Limisphaerales bacterium]
MNIALGQSDPPALSRRVTQKPQSFAFISVHSWFLPALLLIPTIALPFNTPAAERLRVMVETDAGGDPDDEQSLVRFLLYSNEWDVEGIIANRPRARDGENKNSERTGLGIVRRLVNAYGDCYPNLVQHDPRFPKPDSLMSRVLVGHGEHPPAVDRIIEAVDAHDSRPLWFMNWGTDDGSAPSCLKLALDRILKERGPDGYAKFKKRIRLASADKFGAHTTTIDPSFPLWVDTFRPPVDGKRWYHRFSGITAKAGGFDFARDVLQNHGPLGALYPTNTTHWQKEGDTMTFLYLIPTGMNDPEKPGWGSWAGRYGLMEDANGKPHYWANQPDAWRGTNHRDNTLIRWAADLQNDFRARLDWCVKPKNEANHKPIAILNGLSGCEPFIVTARAGSELTFSAEGSSDPDANQTTYHWEPYLEAGDYSTAPQISRADQRTVRIKLPDQPGELHILLILRDNGEPPLAAYRRAIIQIAP